MAALRWRPQESPLRPVALGDRRTEAADAAQILVFAAHYQRTTGKYGERGKQYVHMEAGHAAQNVLLMATSLELGGGMVVAFEDDCIAAVAVLEKDEIPLYLCRLVALAEKRAARASSSRSESWLHVSVSRSLLPLGGKP